MARSTGAQVVQIGKEVTPGTAVAATRRLGSMTIDLKPEADTKSFRPKGSKYTTVVAENKAWSSGKVSGTPCYEEVIYPLASVFTKPVSTQTMDGATPTGAYTHVFSPKSALADDPQTFTLESGDTTLAMKAALMLFTDFDFDVSRGDLSIGGSTISQLLDTAATLTPALPLPATLTPILPGQVSVWLSTVKADLGLTTGTGVRLDGVASLKVKVGKRFAPTWFLNALNASFSGFVEEAAPDLNIDFLAEASVEGIKWIARCHTGQTVFIRLEAIGPVAAAKATYPGLAADVPMRLTWDFATKVTDPGDFSDADGVYAIGPKMDVVHDGAWGAATQITVVNRVATL